MIATSPTLGTSRHGTVHRGTVLRAAPVTSRRVLARRGSRCGIMNLSVGESRRGTTSKSTRNRTLGTEL